MYHIISKTVNKRIMKYDIFPAVVFLPFCVIKERNLEKTCMFKVSLNVRERLCDCNSVHSFPISIFIVQ